jgi:hypothetical protein
MKCSDVDRILPDIVDGVPIEGSQHVDVQSHLRTCQDCSELVSDLKLIASEARHLSDSDSEDPPARVWARIAAELRAEGLIHEPELARPVLVPTRQRRWNPFWLAPVAVAILVAGSYVLVQRSAHPSSQFQQVTGPLAEKQGPQQAPAQQTPAQQTSPQSSASHSPAQTAQVAQSPAPRQNAKPASNQTKSSAAGESASGSSSGPPSEDEEAALAPPSASDDSQFLTAVSTRAPTMRATYANQLQAVNNEIRETRAYLSRYPSDMDARQHLLDVYQQKAMLYQIALDRIQ